MPWKSQKQMAWGNSIGKEKLGAEKVAEFNAASKGMDLPKKAMKTMAKEY